MGLNIADIKVRQCKSAAEVGEINRAVLARKRARNQPPRRIPINDLTAVAFQIPIIRPEPIPAPAWAPPVAMPTIASIIEMVCRAYNVRHVDIVSQRRTKDVVLPRQIACYLAAKLTHHSLPTIAHHFGGRDHTTLVHARQKITRLRAADPKIDAEITNLEQKLGGCPQIKIRGGPWAAYPAMDGRLTELATQTVMPYTQIAATLNREFGVNLTSDACYARTYVLGIKAERRPRPQKQPVIAEAA